MEGVTHFRPKIANSNSRGLKRIPEIQQRLDMWAQWRIGSGLNLSASSPLGYLMDLAAGRRVSGEDDSYGSRVPVDDIECSVIDDAIMELPNDLRQAVVAWHCATSGTLEEVAERVGIVKTTLWRRLAQADHRINEWLSQH